MRARTSFLEPLESRIAPARLLGGTLTDLAADPVVAGGIAPQFQISPDGKTATWVNGDGDTVNLTITKGRLKTANFDITSDPVTGLVTVNLLDISAANFGAKFAGTSITVQIALPSTSGFADIRAINAKGIDLGNLAIGGDLGQIDAGDFDLATPAIVRLQAAQLGFAGSAGQIAGQDTVSKIRGPLGEVQLDELLSAFIDVKGGVAGTIGRLAIGNVDATREDTTFNGSVRAAGAIGEVDIGGTTPSSLTGGAGDFSGVIWSRVRIGRISVAGDVIGGDGFDSGAIFAGSPDIPTAPLAKKIGPVTISGSILGGLGANSGTLYADTKVKSVIVRGSVIGGGGELSGAIVSGGGMADLTIDGDLESGAGTRSGSIVAFSGDVTSIAIGGQIVAGNFALSGIHVNGFLASLSFAGAPHVDGNATDVRALLGVGTITVTGDMNDVFVLAGYNIRGLPRTGNVGIGTVQIGGNFTGGGLLAGAAPGPDGITFSADDVLIRPDPFPTIFSRIANVTVGGMFTPFAILAEKIDAITIAGAPVALTSGKHNDNFLIGSSVIKEIA
jgi:hypothetical protein